MKPNHLGSARAGEGRRLLIGTPPLLREREPSHDLHSMYCSPTTARIATAARPQQVSVDAVCKKRSASPPGEEAEAICVESVRVASGRRCTTLGGCQLDRCGLFVLKQQQYWLCTPCKFNEAAPLCTCLWLFLLSRGEKRRSRENADGGVPFDRRRFGLTENLLFQ